MRKVSVLVLLLSFTLHSSVFAQTTQAAPKRDPARTKAIWTVIGAAAGFGVGFYLGFNAYDDATFAERKILTAALLTALAGGVAGYFIGDARARPASSFQKSTPMRDDAKIDFATPRLRVPEPLPDEVFRGLFRLNPTAVAER